jgi:hypothetical protein
VDVTFLLFGAAALALATPIIAALLRARTALAQAPNQAPNQFSDESAPQFHDQPDHENRS